MLKITDHRLPVFPGDHQHLVFLMDFCSHLKARIPAPAGQQENPGDQLHAVLHVHIGQVPDAVHQRNLRLAKKGLRAVQI